MINIAQALDRACRDAGHAIDGVSIGTVNDKATWKVHPTNLQSVCQAVIDDFNTNDPKHASKQEKEAIAAYKTQHKPLYDKIQSWGGILTDADPSGSHDCIWLSHSTGFPPTFKLKVRKNNNISVLLTLNL